MLSKKQEHKLWKKILEGDKEVFCFETGDFVICDSDCPECIFYKESMEGGYGKSYP